MSYPEGRGGDLTPLQELVASTNLIPKEIQCANNSKTMYF